MSGTLKDAMASFTTGVTVVTAHYEGRDWGMTCNSFNTVSLDPALVLWSIRHSASSHPAFVRGGGYAVSILSREQEALAMQFTRGTQEERFAGVAVERTASNRARIQGALAWFDCELQQAIAAGDHDILIGRVLDFNSFPGQGLAYVRRTFGVLQPLAAPVAN